MQTGTHDGRRRRGGRGTVREQIRTVVLVVLAALTLRATVVQAYSIQSGSMEDTLLVGDYFLVAKFFYGAQVPFTEWRLPAIRAPRPGDVVVFEYPLDRSVDYVKRCVAGPGQTVEIRDKRVYVAGRPFPPFGQVKHVDPSVRSPEWTERDVIPKGAGNRDNYGPITVPPGHYFVMGDNRDNSLDSRYWGCVPADHLVGKAVVVLFSRDPAAPLLSLASGMRWSRVADLIQ